MAGAGVAAAEVCGTPKCQKRPTYVAKESDLHGKRDLHIWQKRPTYMAKEIYKCVKRDLLVWQKTALLHGKKRPALYLKRPCTMDKLFTGTKFVSSIQKLRVTFWQKRPALYHKRPSSMTVSSMDK